MSCMYHSFQLEFKMSLIRNASFNIEMLYSTSESKDKNVSKLYFDHVVFYQPFHQSLDMHL
jgi:hypothetical protein